jgi:hypothetical protein
MVGAEIFGELFAHAGDFGYDDLFAVARSQGLDDCEADWTTSED